VRVYIYICIYKVAPNARERIMALSFIRANVLTHRSSYLRFFASVSTMKVIMRSYLRIFLSINTKYISRNDVTRNIQFWKVSHNEHSIRSITIAIFRARATFQIFSFLNHNIIIILQPVPFQIFLDIFVSSSIDSKTNYIAIKHLIVYSPDVIFLQKGLVLGVYQTEDESNIVLTPTAAKYNESIDGKLLKNIQL